MAAEHDTTILFRIISTIIKPKTHRFIQSSALAELTRQTIRCRTKPARSVARAQPHQCVPLSGHRVRADHGSDPSARRITIAFDTPRRKYLAEDCSSSSAWNKNKESIVTIILGMTGAKVRDFDLPIY